MPTITTTANNYSKPMVGLSVGDTITLTGSGTVQYTTADETTIKSGSATWTNITLGTDNKATITRNGVAIRLLGVSGISTVVAEDGDALTALDKSMSVPYVTTSSKSANWNPTGAALVHPVTGADVALGGGAASRIRTAITSAIGNNAVELEPWLLPALWALGVVYYRGQIIRNSAGNAYMRWPSQTGSGGAWGVTSTGTEPVHTTQVPTLDGTSGNYWMYLGKARGLSAGVFNSNTPASSTAVMSGHVAIVSKTAAGVIATLGLSQDIWGLTRANWPTRLIGLEDTSVATSALPEMLGSNSATVGSPAYSSINMHYGVHFKTNAKWIFLRGSSTIVDQASSEHLIIYEVNGRRISDAMLIKTHTSSPTDTGTLLDLSKYPGSIKDVKIFGMNVMYQQVLHTLNMEPTAFIAPGEVANKFTIAFEGDSLTAGGNGFPTFPGDVWTANVAKMLGASSWYNNAVGSTGFVSDNSGAKTTYINRVNRINLFSPDVLVIMGGHNDVGLGGQQAAVLLYLKTVRASNPETTIFLCGNLLLAAESTATQIASEVIIKAAFDQFADANSVFVPVMTDPKGMWYADGSVNGHNFYLGAAPFTDAHHIIGAYNMLQYRVTDAIRKHFMAK